MVIFDAEASGLGANSYPIEIAWKDPKTGEHDSFLINPKPIERWVEWDRVAAQIHGIPKEQLLQNGIHPIEAAQRLNSQLCGSIAYSDGVDSDNMWIATLFNAVGIEPMFEVRCFYSYLASNNLSKAEYRKCLNKTKTPHRALSDVNRIITSSFEAFDTNWHTYCDWDNQ